MTNLINLGFSLIILGFLMVVIGIASSHNEINFGGLIMIGPIPIGFGNSPILTLIAMVIGLILTLIYLFRSRNA